jgi:hypothetical protein
MAEFNDWRKWKILPVKSVIFLFDYEEYKFETLERSTQFKIGFVTDENDTGGQTPVCISIEGKAVVAQNNYTDMSNFIKDAIQEKCLNVSLHLEANADQPNGAGMLINSLSVRQVFDLDSYNILPEFDITAPSPRLTINITGFIDIAAAEDIAQIFWKLTDVFPE